MQVKFVCKLQQELLLATSPLSFPLFLSYICHIPFFLSEFILSLQLFFVIDIIFLLTSSKSVKVLLFGPGPPSLLSLPAIGPINIFSRGVSKLGWGAFGENWEVDNGRL